MIEIFRFKFRAILLASCATEQIEHGKYYASTLVDLT